MRISSTILVLVLFAARLAPGQPLDESCTVTLNGQTVQVNPDGSFVIPNVAAADLFGAGGPGTAPDFLSDDMVRVVGRCTSGGKPVYFISECFRITAGQTFQVGALAFSDVPPRSVASIAASPQMPTLTVLNQQTTILVTGVFTDGTSGPLNPVLNCAPSFRTSNTNIVSVAPDPNDPTKGLATAKGAGTALITVSLEGAAAVTVVTVSLGDPLTNVTGIVQTEDADPFNGATIKLLVNGMVISGMGVSGGPGLAPGQFMINGVASLLGPISVYAEGIVGGQLRSGVGLMKPPVPGGFTDAGLVTLDGRIFWITNANGNWQTGSNWISGTPPTSTQRAIIDVPADITVTHQTFPATPIVSLQCAESFHLSGSMAVAEASFVNGTFSQSAGNFGGNGMLTVNGPYSWTGGTMGVIGGGGTTLLNAGMTISGTATKSLFGRTLTNANNGTITFTDSGILSFGSQPVINNQAGCTFDVQTDADWNGGLPFGAFNNEGTLRKSAGSGVTTLAGLALNNSGSVEVEIGTLQVAGGNSSGTFVVDPGAALDFSGGFGPPQTITGSLTVPAGGTVLFASGTTNLNGETDVEGQIVVTGGFNTAGVANFNAAASMGVAASAASIGNNGTLSFAGPANAGSISHGNGTLSGAGTITVTGPYTWTEGTMTGGGTTLLNAGMTISGTAGKNFFGRSLTNAGNGTIIWTGSGNVGLASQPVINNQAGCTFDVQTDADFFGGLPFGAFNNSGTLRKSAGSGVTTLGGFALNNSGSVEVEIGTLSVAGGNSSGAFVVDPGAALDFSGGFGPPQTITGSLTVPAGGTVLFASGTTNLNGETDVEGQIVVTGGFNTAGVANFNAAASMGVAASAASIGNNGTLSFAGPASVGSLSHAAGTLTGAGPLTVTGAYAWTEGTMTGGGTTLLNAGMTISGTAGKNFFGRSLTNAGNGTIIWTGSGNVGLASQPVINNQAGCTFDVQTDADFFGGLPFGAFNNSGTLRKSAGSGVTTLGGFALNNSGFVEVEIGTLQVAGGNSSGTFVVDPGAALDFSGGFGPPQTITGSLTVPAGGTVLFASGTTNLNGETDVEGQIVVTGGFNTAGVANFNAAASMGVAASAASIGNNGTLSFAGPANAGSISHGRGTLTGAGTLTVTGPYTWTEGTMTGGGTTLLNGGMNMSGILGKNLFSRTLTNANNGTIILTGSGGLTLGSGSVINNAIGSTFDIQADGVAVGTGGGPVSTFSNAGTLRKSGGTGTSTISNNLNNSGTIAAESGTLQFTGFFTFNQTAGSTLLAGGSITVGVGFAFQINGGTIGLGPDTASGTITGSVTLGNASADTVPRPGGAGTLTIVGTYTQTAGALAIELGGLTQGTEYDRLTVTGNAILGGTLELSLIDGFVPNVGDTFQVVTVTGTRTGTFADVITTNFPAGLGANVIYTANAATVMIVPD